MKKNRLLLFILGISILLRLVNINQSLWLDESASTLISRLSLEVILTRNTGDFMPSLFYFLLHFWMLVWASEVWMRLLPLLFGVGSIFLVYSIGKILFSKSIGLLSAFLLALSPFHIYYSIEIRPYSLVIFLVLLSTYFLLKNNFVRYALTAVFLPHTLYTAVFIFLAHGLYIGIYEKKQIKHWIASMLIVGIFFIPWLPVFVKQLDSGHDLVTALPGWGSTASSPIIKALPLILAKFTLGRVTIDNKIMYGIVFLYTSILALFLLFTGRKRQKNQIEKTLILFIVPIVGATLFSFYLPVIAPQRVIYALPFFLILMSAGLHYFKPRLRLFLTICFLLPSMYGLLQYYINPRFQREQWREATAFVEAHADKDTGVVFAFPEPFGPYLWYRKQENLGRGFAKGLVVSDSDIDDLDQYAKQKNRIFFFQYLTELTDPKGKIASNLQRSDFSLKQTYDFSGVGFIYEYQK